MSTRKLLALLLVPLVVMVLVLVVLASAEGQDSPRADALGTLLGMAFGVYALVLVLLWQRARKAK